MPSRVRLAAAAIFAVAAANVEVSLRRRVTATHAALAARAEAADALRERRAVLRLETGRAAAEAAAGPAGRGLLDRAAAANPAPAVPPPPPTLWWR